MGLYEEKMSKNRWLLGWLLLLGYLLAGPQSVFADESEAVEQVAAPVPFSKPTSVAAHEPTTAEEARKELQQLLDETLSLATEELYKKATFYPFLAGINMKGQVELVGIPESKERPAPRTAIKALRKAAQQLSRKKRFRAAALYVDFVAERKDTAIKQPGIRVELEHRFPDALSVFIPYFIHSDNRISLMTPQFMPVEPKLFTKKKK